MLICSSTGLVASRKECIFWKLQKLFSEMRFLFPPSPSPGSAAFHTQSAVLLKWKGSWVTPASICTKQAVMSLASGNFREEMLSLTTEEGGPVPFLLLCICHVLASTSFLFSCFHVFFRSGLFSYLVTRWQLLVHLWDQQIKRHG